MKFSWRSILVYLLAAGVVAALVYAFLPRPLAADLSPVIRGPLQVSVREDGRTRVRERYVIASPLAGRLLRVQLKPGACVSRGQVLAVIEPADPQLLDPRAQAEAQARVRAAEAARQQALAQLERARANQEFAQTQLERTRNLFQAEAVSREELDRVELAARTASQELAAAQFAVQIAEFELEQARAALIRSQPGASVESQFEIRSPVDGQVLRVLQESATIVTPGTPLLEVGDPRDLEVEVDVLSTDAVNIRPGARVWLEHWGGEQPLEARVRLVEPAAFTKVSALGVEEQRVWVIADFTAPPELWQPLGHAYRVEARIVTWESEDVLKVPTGALFREGNAWAVFVVEGGRAQLRLVEIGQRGEREAQVLSGLAEGDRVIVHPSDRVQPGTTIRSR